MKRINILHTSLIMLLLVISSCNNNSNVALFPEIADIATFHGNLQSNIIVIHSQGGPITTLEDGFLKEIISETDTQSALYVNVHQAQTSDPSTFTNSKITFNQAKQYDQDSVENLVTVIEYFTDGPDNVVYVLGISFGAFMTQELIATHGIDVADGYLILGGRLDIDEATWIPFSQGKLTKYIYDQNKSYVIQVLENDNIEGENMSKLAAGLGYHRYTMELAGINDLSKITYVYGDRDDQVGPLSQAEQDFLTDRDATVILAEDGDHDSTIGIGLTVLKQVFNIP